MWDSNSLFAASQIGLLHMRMSMVAVTECGLGHCDRKKAHKLYSACTALHGHFINFKDSTQTAF